MRRTITTLLTPLCLSAAALASDPVPPAGGWKILSTLNAPIRWSDGYRTLYDLYYPDVAASVKPARGWPVVLVVHGGGRSRKIGWAQTTMKKLASLGYVACGYDVRGDGATPRLNPAWGKRKGTHSRRLADVAEFFKQLDTQRPRLLDETRLGVYGQSQGGGHAYRSAAYSGRTLPGLSTRMPVIKAAVGDIQVFDTLEDATPMGTMFTAKSIVGAFEARSQYPAFWAAVRSDNPSAFRAASVAQPGWVYLPQLRTSDVPLLVMNSWDDSNHVVNTNADDFGSLKAGVPHRFFLTTGGHASASNQIEDLQGLEMLCRWFDRFLKARNNGIAKEPFAEVAVIPNKGSDYQDARYAWKHRQVPNWPVTSNRTSFYLNSPRTMKRTQYTGAAYTARINNSVAAGYDAEDFVRDGGKYTNVVTKIPMSVLDWTSPPATSSVELTGRSTFECDVTPDRGTFQLAASLYDVDPSNNKRYITSGVVGVRGTTRNRRRVTVTLADVSYVMPAGHRFRLELKNMHVREHPGNKHLYTAPYFTPFRLFLHIDGTSDPRLVLPLRAPEVSMTPRIAIESAASGIDHRIPIDGSKLRAGNVYLTIFGASGTAPGLSTTPRIPMNFDAFTQLGLLLANTPAFPSWIGVLDANGKANPRLVVPPALAGSLPGTRLSFTTLVFRPNGSFDVANPVTLRITP